MCTLSALRDNFASGNASGFCFKPFGEQIRSNLPRLLHEGSLNRIGYLTRPSPNLPRLMNRDLQPVLQHFHVCFPRGSGSNLFKSGIPFALDAFFKVCKYADTKYTNMIG
jgi:hypothetical protein